MFISPLVFEVLSPSIYIPTALGAAVILLGAIEDTVILFPDAYTPNGISPSARLAAVTAIVPPLNSTIP